jgi:hypothetical protein
MEPLDLDALAHDAEVSEAALEAPPRPLAAGPPPAFFGLTPEEVRNGLVEAGWQSYRAEQVLDWVYRKRTRDPDAMTNLGKDQREQLSRLVDLGLPRIHRQINSPKGDSSKYALELKDKARVESVAMLSRRGVTLRLDASRLRDGVRVLRNRDARAGAQSQGRRAVHKVVPCRDDREVPASTSCSWAWASRS